LIDYFSEDITSFFSIKVIEMHKNLKKEDTDVNNSYISGTFR